MRFVPFTKRRLAKGELCEMVVGQDENSRQPHLIQCKHPATMLYYWKLSNGVESTIPGRCCGDCATRIREQHEAKGLTP